MRLNGVERRHQPLNRPSARARILRQQRLAALSDVLHDGSGLEQHEAVFLEDRHLAEGLQRPVLRLVLIALAQQTAPVWQAGLLQRPAHAQIPYLTPSELGNPFESGNRDHEVSLLPEAIGSVYPYDVRDKVTSTRCREPSTRESRPARD